MPTDNQPAFPMISTWCGVPLAEVPRDELEAALTDAYRQIGTMRDQLCRQSVEHINDLAAFAKQRATQ